MKKEIYQDDIFDFQFILPFKDDPSVTPRPRLSNAVVKFGKNGEYGTYALGPDKNDLKLLYKDGQWSLMVLKDNADFLPAGMLDVNVKVYDLKGSQFINEDLKFIVMVGSGENPLARSELQQRRLDICSGCPFLNKELMACMECGCFMPEKVKLVYSSCPIGKW